MEAQKGGKRRLVLGIFAQVDAGKTTLSEALLYKTGALRTLGRVDRGDAHLDTHELERARGITIFSKQARFETERLAVTLLDTPGHADFAPEAERVMPVIDCALLLVSGTDGVQGHTLTLWRRPRRPAGRCAHRAQRPLRRAGRRRVRRPQLRGPAGALSEHRRIG